MRKQFTVKANQIEVGDYFLSFGVIHTIYNEPVHGLDDEVIIALYTPEYEYDSGVLVFAADGRDGTWEVEREVPDPAEEYSKARQALYNALLSSVPLSHRTAEEFLSDLINTYDAAKESL